MRHGSRASAPAAAGVVAPGREYADDPIEIDDSQPSPTAVPGQSNSKFLIRALSSGTLRVEGTCLPALPPLVSRRLKVLKADLGQLSLCRT